MFGFGISELLIIFLIILILFGAKKIPELGSGLGEGIKNFTKSFKNPEADEKKKQAPNGETKEKAKTETNA
ncbi:MAG: twin-arginine translocase TatA/TatE family subunit [Nitrospinota bacterium]